MDFSNIMNSKSNTPGEVNTSPVPPLIKNSVLRSGLWICSYYENVPSTDKASLVLRNFNFYVITHLIDGNGIYLDENTNAPVQLNPGAGIIVSPTFKNSYGGNGKNFVEDSIGFMGPAADVLYQAGIIRDGLINLGQERRLLPIIQKLREATLPAQLEANIMLLQLLMEISKESYNNTQTQPHSARLQRLTKEISNTPGKWWTVKEMAEYCNISANYLRLLFKQQYDASPKHYIENIKMNKAIELLSNSNLKVSEIALKLGYVDPYHFIRRFTATFSVSPSRYRKNYSPRQT